MPRACATIVRGTSHAASARNTLASAPARSAACLLSTNTAPYCTGDPDRGNDIDCQVAAVWNPRTANSASAAGTKSAAAFGQQDATISATITATTVHGRTPNTVRPSSATGTRATA